MAEFSLPDFPRVDDEILREISRRHDLDAKAGSPLPEVGIFNPGSEWTVWTP
ncbi:MAG: hypothetical protein AVDCRST_MAG12-1574 [uncultured Rubrobacteraceae bacterium]|uniref:Uncharacterized protein n=1 Tax=uncultured Rubrobacteraceae bacterium TaxID=349277 RepID=A0A6J4S123_9ACTN|nr:MAG: hypothetical protein AVDCRST_MAG12-1574 [uncultured Rubrobacteraceae bacterium]